LNRQSGNCEQKLKPESWFRSFSRKTF